jgi:hypothetical protein
MSHHCLDSWPADVLPVALIGMNAKLMAQWIRVSGARIESNKFTVPPLYNGGLLGASR